MLELATGVYLSDIRYSGNPDWEMTQNMSREFQTAGAFPAAAWHLGNYGRFDQNGSVKFSLSANRKNGLTPVAFVQTERNGERVMTRSRDQMPEDEMALFTKAVKTYLTEESELRTGKNPQNMIRLILPSADGSWTIEEFAIVAQDNHLFLTRQRLYAGRAFRAHDEAMIVAPGFSQWGEDFFMMLEDAFRNCALPTGDSFQKPETTIPDVPENGGVVKYYNLAQQWGSAYIREGSAIVEARLYFGQAKAERGRIVYFEPGEAVAFGAVAPARTTHPDQTTLFKYEIISVRSAPKPTPVETHTGC